MTSCAAPDIPPMDPSNPCETQNFENAFLKMKQVINDEINADTVQEWEQADFESTDGEDLISTPSRPHIFLTHSLDDIVGSFKGYTFNDPPSIIIDGMERDKEEEGSETAAETVPGDDDPAKQSILKPQLVAWSSAHPTQQKPESPEREPLSVITSLPFPTTPCSRFQISRSRHTHVRLTQSRTQYSATEAPSRHHTGLEPKLSRYQPNLRRTRQERTSAPKPDSRLSDTEEDYADALRGDALDNCPRDLENVDGGSNNGPRSIKTVSHHSLSMLPAPRHQTHQMGIRCPNIRF